jgi:hypothetical protein
MIDATHLYPSISPWNIWDLPYGVWLAYAMAIDSYRTAQASIPG